MTDTKAGWSRKVDNAFGLVVTVLVAGGYGDVAGKVEACLRSMRSLINTLNKISEREREVPSTLNSKPVS